MFFVLKLIVLWLLGQPCAPESQFPQPRPDPIKGIVYGGMAYACERDARQQGLTSLWFAPLDGSRPPRSQLLVISAFAPPRWHAHRGVVWAAGSSNMWGAREFGQTHHIIHRLELAPLLRGKFVRAPGAEPSQSGGFSSAQPVKRAATLAFFAPFQGELFYDCLPEGIDRVLVFRLTNVRGRYVPIPDGHRIEQTEDEKKNPKWSLKVFSRQGKYAKNKEDWEHTPWALEATIAVGFTEQFQVLAKGDDYYFVTTSGKVFVARKPAKGKNRTMQPVWTDWKRPVWLFITDADRGTTFLFVGPAKKGERPAFFELAPRAQPMTYDPALLKWSLSKHPIRLVLRHAQVLVAMKKIKG